jgi:hypothetical protein
MKTVHKRNGMAVPVRGLARALLLIGVLTAMFSLAPAAGAETGKQALILASTVTGGTASAEAARATADGFTVTLVSDATWATMTAAQFAEYQLVVVGDPTCSSVPAVVSQNAAALASAVMGHAGTNTKAGNRLLIGTDPRFHYSQGGQTLIEDGIDFAGVQEGATGLYLDFTCVDPDYDGNGIPDAQDKLLPLLTIATPNWSQNQGPPCGGDVSLIANAAQFSTLHSSTLRGWSCSVHESFPSFPTDWSPLAIATDTPTHPTCGTDVDTGAAKCGEAYLLIAGSGITSSAPNLALNPPTATNPVGTQHTVTATVTNTNGSAAAGVHVTFVVTGANAGAAGTCVPATCNSDSAGHVTFTYTGANAGDDTINASITVEGSTQTATASKTWGTTDDTEPPMCMLTVKSAGPPATIQIMIVDGGSGLASIVVTTSSNADTPVPPFTVGTNLAQLITATKIDQTKGSSVAITVTDVDGNVTKCDPLWPGKKLAQAKKTAHKSMSRHARHSS